MFVVCDKSVFFPGTPVSSTNKTDHYNITEILLKRALRRLDRIVSVHFFRAWLSRVFHHKTMLLSTKCNGKVNYCKWYLPLILGMPFDCLQIKNIVKTTPVTTFFKKACFVLDTTEHIICKHGELFISCIIVMSKKFYMEEKILGPGWKSSTFLI